jgi:hypothetical protein
MATAKPVHARFANQRNGRASAHGNGCANKGASATGININPTTQAASNPTPNATSQQTCANPSRQQHTSARCNPCAH